MMRAWKPAIAGGLTLFMVGANAAQSGAPAPRGILTCDVTSVESAADGKPPPPPRDDTIEMEVNATDGFTITPKTITMKKTMMLEKPGAVHKPGSAWSHSESVDMHLDRMTGKLHTVHTLNGRIMRKTGEIVAFQTTETVDGVCSQTSGPAGLIVEPPTTR